VCGGRRLNHLGVEDAKGIYIEPTVIRLTDFDALKNLKLIQEEIFFPLLPIVRIDSRPEASQDKKLTKDQIRLDKMLRIITTNPFGLRVSFWSRSHAIIRKVISSVHNCGLLRVNCRHVDFSLYLATHGGTGKTGGPHGEMNYIWQKTSHLQGVSVKL
jgi:acyl-CoA reductase-like NAD-dependent aldehyde dehydrogenase